MLDPDRLSFEFEAGADKPRLDEFVATRLPKISLTRIRRLIAEGDVLLNDERSLKGVRLQLGDKVSVKIFAAEKSSATPEPIPLDILFEDEHIIAVNKPVGLLAHPSNTEKSGALTNALAPEFTSPNSAVTLMLPPARVRMPLFPANGFKSELTITSLAAHRLMFPSRVAR